MCGVCFLLQNETEVSFGQGPCQPRPGWLYYLVGPSYVFHDDDDDNDDRNRKNTCFMRGEPPCTGDSSECFPDGWLRSAPGADTSREHGGHCDSPCHTCDMSLNHPSLESKVPGLPGLRLPLRPQLRQEGRASSPPSPHTLSPARSLWPEAPAVASPTHGVTVQRRVPGRHQVTILKPEDTLTRVSLGLHGGKVWHRQAHRCPEASEGSPEDRQAGLQPHGLQTGGPREVLGATRVTWEAPVGHLLSRRLALDGMEGVSGYR